uniref:KRAB-A domain containing 1 n=2 Tax=Sciurus vulgaris TaxID=55149 RepID=A0A8D2B193_SCIVU
MARVVPISFKDLEVRFSEEEWRLLEERQREFYRDVMRENYETLVSVGTDELLPLSAFLSPTEPAGAMEGGSHSDEGQEPPTRGSPQGGQPRHSLHLNALVQLVKGIPEFLFGEVKDTEDVPESRGTSLDQERVSPEAIVAVEVCPPQGLLSCLPDSPVCRPSLATTPASSSSSSSPPGDRGLGRPLLIKTDDKPWPTGRGGPGTTGEELSPPTCSPGQRKSHQTQEKGTTGTGISPGNSPLQGLINCLKEILVPGPQNPEAAPNLLPAVPLLGASRPATVELVPASPPWPVKTESPSGDPPLQGLLNCLKEIPEAQDRRPSPSGAGDLQLQEDPGALKRNSGGPRYLQTPPTHPGPGTGSTFAVVKVEDSWPQSALGPTSCPLSRQGRGLSATGDTKGIRTPCWGPTAQASRASSSPLAALEACLKGIPPGGSSPPRILATSGSQRSELRSQGSHSEEATKEPPLPLGLQGCVREGLAQPPGPRGTPTSFSSACSSDGDLDFGSPSGSQGQRLGKGCLPGSSPLQGLENCLKELPVPGQRPAWSCSSAANKEPRRAEPKNWMAYKEGLRDEASESSCLRQGREVPTRSLHLASPQASTSSCIPTCHQGFKEQGTIGPEPWKWLQDGAASRPSPLHCLETSLRGILPVRPLRFACLVGPGPGPGPSPSPGSSSSLSSSDEDARMEPELWRPPLQEMEHLRSCKHPVPLSPGPGRSPSGNSSSSPGEGSERRELEAHSDLGAEAAGHPWPAPRLDERPRGGEELRSLEPGCGRHSVAARTQRKQLPRDPPEPPSESPPPAAVSPLWPATSLQPPCSCGRPLQQELHSLGAALTEKLDRLATALAGLAQEVATMRTQVDRLGKRPQGPGPKRQASWPWSLPRGPRWANGLGHRHTPYWRQKGPTRPKPKILRVQAEGCRTGDSLGLSRGRVHLVPPDAPPAEPSRPRPSPSQQPPSLAPNCHTVLTGHPFLGHPGCHQGPLPTFVPAALPP